MNDTLAALMSHLAALFDGSMGWAILFLALAVRLALLPLTLYLARRMLANGRKIAALQPQVDAIKQRLAADPPAMFAAISDLYHQNGAHMIDRSSLWGALVQLPVFGLLYKAVGSAGSSGPFLWIKSLASPDAALTAIVLLLTAVSAYYFPSASGVPATFLIVVQLAVAAFFMWKLSAAMGLYWAASSAVGAVQTGVLRYEQRRLARSVNG